MSLLIELDYINELFRDFRLKTKIVTKQIQKIINCGINPPMVTKLYILQVFESFLCKKVF